MICRKFKQCVGIESDLKDVLEWALRTNVSSQKYALTPQIPFLIHDIMKNITKAGTWKAIQ